MPRESKGWWWDGFRVLPKAESEVYVEQLTVGFHHDVVKMTITDA